MSDPSPHTIGGDGYRGQVRDTLQDHFAVNARFDTGLQIIFYFGGGGGSGGHYASAQLIMVV